MSLRLHIVRIFICILFLTSSNLIYCYCTVVKLDIDTSSIENQLFHQMRNDANISNIVDVFYYEHHVKQQELLPYWRGSAKGSVGESIKFMNDIRATGVASHYWP